MAEKKSMTSKGSIYITATLLKGYAKPLFKFSPVFLTQGQSDIFIGKILFTH
jgi:hypothetical protein